MPCYHCESTSHTKSLHSHLQSAQSTWEVALPHFWVYGIMFDYHGRPFTFVTIQKILFDIVANFSIITYLFPWKSDLNRCMLLQLLLSCKLMITVINIAKQFRQPGRTQGGMQNSHFSWMHEYFIPSCDLI